MRNILLISIFSMLIVVSLTTCIKKDFKEPELAGCDLDFQPNISIEDFMNLYSGLNEDAPLLIDTSLIIKGTVIANDESGNFYKQFVIQDSTEAGAQTALMISVNKYETHNEYKIGDMIYVKCEGLYFGMYGGVNQIGFINEGDIGRIPEPIIDQHIFNACNGKPIEPKLTFIHQLTVGVPDNSLIKLENVQFRLSELDETYADAGENVTSDQFIYDCQSNNVLVRTSGYSSFAGEPIPHGNGTIIAIKSSYNDEPQLLIRDITEVQFNDSRCTVYEKDFDNFSFEFVGDMTVDNLASGNWFSYDVIGETQWVLDTHDGDNYYAYASNYINGSNYQSEVWLVSPKFNLTLLSNPVLNFQSASNYSGDDVAVKVSVNYSGSGDPSSATWVNLSPTLSSGGFDWVNSNNQDLSAFKQASVYIAFVYTGSNSDGSTWEIDDIQLKDE